MRHLDEPTVAALLDPVEVTDALARAIGEWGRGEADTTVRLRASSQGAMASAMAAVVPSMGVSGGKIYATVAGRFTFHVVLFDLAGQLLCTLDGGALTEIRTPALSAVALRRLAPQRPRRAAVLGTGLEALPHVEMLARELELDELRVWGRSPERAHEVARRARALGVAVTATAHADDAAADADVVVTVTSADEPIVSADAISDRALVCAVGATKPGRCELPPALFARSAAVVADSVDGSRHECGDLLAAVAAGSCSWDDVAELRDVVAGTSAVPRAGVRGPVVFETQGLALQDVVAATLAWRRYADSPTEDPEEDQ